MLYTVLATIGFLSMMGQVIAGQVYIYHIIISILYSAIFLVVTVTFDAEILNKCE